MTNGLTDIIKSANGLGDIIKKLKEIEITEKAAAMGAKVLKAALSAALTLAVTWTIDKVVKLIDKWVTTTKEAAEQQEKLREQVAENTRAFQEETDAIDGLLSKYVTLVSQNTDLSAVKKDLTEIQNQLIDTYGVEADSIDLLNGKLSENIDLINQRRLAGAEKYLEDNAAQIRDAKKEKDQKQKSISSILKISDMDEHKEDLDKFALTHNMLRTNTGLGGNTVTYDLKRDTIDNQIQTLSEFAELLRSFGDDGYDTKYYDKIIAEKNELIEKQERINGLLEDAAENERIISELKISPELDSQLKSGLDELVSQQQELNDLRNGNTEGSIFQIKQKEDEIKSLTSSLFDLAGANTEWNDRITSTINSFETGASNAITSTADLEKAFYESLDDMQKGTLKNIELIEKAMQNLANGKYVSWDDFLDIKEFDPDGVIFRPEQIGDELKIDIKQLQRLKDNYLVDPIIESLQEENQSLQDQIESTNGIVNGLKDQLEYELLILDAQIAQGANSASEDNLIREQKQKVQEIRDKIDEIDKIKDYGDQIERNNLLIEMWNTHLGDTIDKTEMLKNRQEAADNYAKAMTSKIDSVINSHESEKDVLEKEKEVLNEQLDTLEKQQKAIEDIIDDYKSVVDMVGDVTDKEIDLLKKQQEAEEKAVQAKIDALKEAREQQEEENTLTEKQLALQEKLRDLEKARQTKVRTYSSEKGWYFDVDKEAVANAQTAVDDAQADYDKAVDDKAYNDQISALEKEKDLISKNFEDQIKAYEDYYDEWKTILDEQTEAENEQIAQQILGSEWREKIKDKDSDVLNTFKSNFEGYNTQLNNLTNTEIANLKLSIEAKEKEIDAKEKQIQSWKDYKTQVESSINSIKSKYEDYVDLLDQIVLDEKSSYKDRERALDAFIDTYQGYVDEILNIQSQLSDDNVVLNIDTNIPEIKEQIATLIENYRDGVEAMQRSLEESLTGYGIVNNEWDAKLVKAANALRGFSNGGTVDYTGIAAVHGSKKSSEVIFNAAQSKQLYDMVMKGEFADLAAARAAEGFTSVLKSIESARTFNKNINNTNNSNTSSIVIQHMDINGVQNPAQFAKEFNKNMEQYLRNVYAESLVN